MFSFRSCNNNCKQVILEIDLLFKSLKWCPSLAIRWISGTIEQTIPLRILVIFQCQIGLDDYLYERLSHMRSTSANDHLSTTVCQQSTDQSCATSCQFHKFHLYTIQSIGPLYFIYSYWKYRRYHTYADLFLLQIDLSFHFPFVETFSSSESGSATTSDQTMPMSNSKSAQWNDTQTQFCA